MTSDRAAARTRAVLAMVFGASAERPFDIHLWDGSIDPGQAEPRSDFAVAFRRRGALRRMLFPPSELSIAESLVSGDVEVVGCMESAMGLADVIGQRIKSPRALATLIARVAALPSDDDPDVESAQYTRWGGAKVAIGRRSPASEIRFHYDVGNEFYALWLDPQMVYTCAYYRTPDMSLAEAQTAKLDHLCRKLRLQDGERLLDIGCGWGALVMHAAEHYGVRAVGITLSAAQAEWARCRIAQRGLADQCEVLVRDFRDLPASERFQKICSVGVTEHVAESEQPAYFARAFAALEPGGLFLNHSEVSNLAARRRHTMSERLERRLWKRDQFIDRYVFPGAKLVPLGSIIRSAERTGFETRDVESLREHYTLTLRAWLRELEANRRQAVALVGDRTYRVWQLYMSVAAYGFDRGAIGLAQVLLSKPTVAGKSGLPMTREDLYGAMAGELSSTAIPIV